MAIKTNFNGLCQSGKMCHICRLDNDVGLSHRLLWKNRIQDMPEQTNFQCPKGKPWISLTISGKVVKQSKKTYVKKNVKKPKLTIGMATYDDFDGVYFTCQALRNYHKQIIDQCEIIVVDNNPGSKSGIQTKKYCDNIGITYIPYQKKKSTSIREVIFLNAKSQYVLCLDSHVMLQYGSILQIVNFYNKNPDSKDLIHGVLMDDNGNVLGTHLNPVWNDHFYGTWGVQQFGQKEIIQIPMHGLGLFSCKKSQWKGFNQKFSGFGGEQGYIHQKFRRGGGKILCLRNVVWNHRFYRPNGQSYTNSFQDRFRNYIIGHLQLGLQIDKVVWSFKDVLSKQKIQQIISSCSNIKDISKIQTFQFINVKSIINDQIKQAIGKQLSFVAQNFSVIFDDFSQKKRLQKNSVKYIRTINQQKVKYKFYINQYGAFFQFQCQPININNICEGLYSSQLKLFSMQKQIQIQIKQIFIGQMENGDVHICNKINPNTISNDQAVDRNLSQRNKSLVQKSKSNGCGCKRK